MKYLLKNAKIFGFDSPQDLSVGTGKEKIIDCQGLTLIPGLVDVHVHFREPGFSYKETIKTGSLAAAAGGFCDVCTMPNLQPVPDSIDAIMKQIEIIERDAAIGVHPYASITKKQCGLELSDMEKLRPLAVAFSDDGRGVQSDDMMLKAMSMAKKLDAVIAAHCEDNSLLNGGYIHDGEYAKAHGHKGIPSASEYEQIKRDIKLAQKTGVKYHVCHISTKESVDAIRKAKAVGVDITCETAPHYLVLSDKDLQEDGRFKMNPPLRDESDRLALIEGIKDGTIDMIATDHAPHSAEEKSKGLEKSLMGVVGLETSFPILYTYLVKTGIITFNKLIELMHTNPCRRFNIKSGIEYGSFSLFNLDEKYTVNPESFHSLGRATPFEGFEVFGKCVMTFYKEELIWKQNMM